MKYFSAIKLANMSALNAAAKRFLPFDWQGDEELHVLSLMRWGLENGIKIRPKAPNHPDEDDVEACINRLSRMHPDRAMRFLTNPAGLENEVCLDENDLLVLETREDAAALLLESLYDCLIACRP